MDILKNNFVNYKMAGITNFKESFLKKKLPIISICEKFQSQLVSLYKHLLTCTNKAEQIEKLNTLSQKFFSLKNELTLAKSGFEMVNKFDYLIYRFSKDLLEMMKIIGSNKCSNVLELVLGDEFKEQIKEFELLELYDKIFIPIRFKIKEPSSNNSIISSKSKIVPKSISLTTKDKIFVFYGRFVSDPLNLYKNYTYIKNKINVLKEESRRLFLPGVLKRNL